MFVFIFYLLIQHLDGNTLNDDILDTFINKISYTTKELEDNIVVSNQISNTTKERIKGTEPFEENYYYEDDFYNLTTVLPPAFVKNYTAIINEMVKEAEKEVAQMKSMELEYIRKGEIYTDGPYVRMSSADSQEGIKRLAKDAYIHLTVAKYLINRYNFTSDQLHAGVSRLNLSTTILPGIEFPSIDQCDKYHHSKYRTTDGSCNNEKNPYWGKSYTPYPRVVKPAYFDGYSMPRAFSTCGTACPLPLSRLVRTTMNPEANITSSNISMLFMQWGQYVNHDMTLAAQEILTVNGTPIAYPNCCKTQKIDSCTYPIAIPPDDPFYSQFKLLCHEFVRSSPVTTTQEPFLRQQLNINTAYIDASQIYGSTEEVAKTLRTYWGGRLVSNPAVGQKDLLPTAITFNCPARIGSLPCFRSGDSRINDQITLTIMHTLWMREHNRIAEQLSELHPKWEDEIIFQESRRIIGAQVQHIHFTEFLPVLLGKKLPPYKGYNPKVNAAIYNEFAVSAYRFGHSLIDKHYELKNYLHQNMGSSNLLNLLGSPFELYRGGKLDQYIQGIADQPSQRVDRFYSAELFNHFFQGPKEHYGLDLITVNIQRGRDHGLPGYVKLREWCGMKKAETFDDLLEDLPEETIKLLKKVYTNTFGELHVEDVDMYTASVAENHILGGTIGPTIACMIKRQFEFLRYGDRYWYENTKSPGAFTKEQLAEIKKTSLARIICTNTDDIATLQPRVMELANNSTNRLMLCENIPSIDLTKWKDEKI